MKLGFNYTDMILEIVETNLNSKRCKGLAESFFVVDRLTKDGISKHMVEQAMFRLRKNKMITQSLQLFDYLQRPKQAYTSLTFSYLICNILENGSDGDMEHCYSIFQKINDETIIQMILHEVSQLLDEPTYVKTKSRMIKFDELRSWYLRKYLQNKTVDLAILTHLNKFNVLQFSDCIKYSCYLPDTYDWIPKKKQISKVLVDWMYTNNIDQILKTLNSYQWFNFFRTDENIILTLSKFLANHGHLTYSLEFLHEITSDYRSVK
eukprot:UN02751